MIRRQFSLFAPLPFCSFYIPSNAKTRTMTTKEKTSMHQSEFSAVRVRVERLSMDMTEAD